jgi:gluconolactonase
MRTSFLITITLIAAVGCSDTPKQEVAVPAAVPAVAAPTGVGTVERLDPAFDGLVAKDALIEKVAGGFKFTEGPLWRPDGTLWFSDVQGNVVRSVTPDGQVKVLIENAAGVSTAPPDSYSGPNGMVEDKDGTVLMVQHFNRQIVRITPDLKMTPVVSKFEGKRLNSPNDLVFGSDGSLYFTDPPYGLAKMDDDPAKEVKFNGVYRYSNGKLQALIRDLNRPNGLAFSPDFKTLYVANSDPAKNLVMRYDVAANGSVSGGKVFADMTGKGGDGLADGVKVDSKGNVYTTGPLGVWVFAPDGKHLGTIKPPEVPANCGWGDDGKTLYITANTSIYKIKTLVGK